MQYRPLGRSPLKVSTICLGTMTWGQQNDVREAHAQLDRAVAAGVNFIDTAETYPVPPMAGTYGRTEEILGAWLAGRKDRDKLVIATKVVGPAPDRAYIRGGKTRLDRANIRDAIEGSLKRLKTDYVDLYQLHWPDRKANYFGKLHYEHDEADQPVGIEETLAALAELVKSGLVRHVGLSNETPWGTMRFLALAAEKGWPRAVSIQNPYSLLNRSFEVGLAEVAIRESIGLLAYSPLGMGVLSGKYLDGAQPANARLTLFTRFKRYSGKRVEDATRAFVGLAKTHGLDPAQMALAWVISRRFATSAIIGATSPAQLDADLAAADLTLSKDVIEGIEKIGNEFAYPSA
jgi:aryl-alcohol dehydrogenase-like predicted oxidoreductase